MTQPVSNLRVRRTQKLLREALIELIEERGFEALTIGELTSRAMVSRAAFYRNYQDKYDLVEQIFEEAMSALLNAVGELGREHPPEIWVKFFEHIAQYERLYRGRCVRLWLAWSKSVGTFLTDRTPPIASSIPSQMSLCQTSCPRCLWKPSPGGLSKEDPTPPKRSQRAALCLPLHSSKK
jgi:AcrR family transcriptional regulator